MSTTETPAVFDALVEEIAQNHRRGRILVAVDGAEADSTRSFADALADAVRSAGTAAYRVSAERVEQYASEDDASPLRAVLAGFRTGSLERDDVVTTVPADAVLIVDGRFLLRPRLRAAWHFRVWLEGDVTLSDDAYELQVRYVRDQEPRAAADAIYDVSGDGPARIFSDSC
jgi:hypothetical protein